MYMCRVFNNENILPLLAVITSPEIFTISMFMRLGSLYHILHDLDSGQYTTIVYGFICVVWNNINMYYMYIYKLIRIAEGRKKEASKVKQTTRQSNTAHPRQSLFQRKMSCLGWDV